MTPLAFEAQEFPKPQGGYRGKRHLGSYGSQDHQDRIE